MKMSTSRLIEVLRERGEMRCSDVVTAFCVSLSTAQDHLAAARRERRTFIVRWEPPTKYGGYTPVYAPRNGDEVDAPRPAPKGRSHGAPRDIRERDERIVVRRQGLNAIHVERAAVHAHMGPWAGLTR